MTSERAYHLAPPHNGTCPTGCGLNPRTPSPVPRTPHPEPMPKISQARIRELVRHFKENGMKMMLEHPANVRDVLRLADVPWFKEIGFDQLEHIKTTFIRRNYRHL